MKNSRWHRVTAETSAPGGRGGGRGHLHPLASLRCVLRSGPHSPTGGCFVALGLPFQGTRGSCRGTWGAGHAAPERPVPPAPSCADSPRDSSSPSSGPNQPQMIPRSPARPSPRSPNSFNSSLNTSLRRDSSTQLLRKDAAPGSPLLRRYAHPCWTSGQSSGVRHLIPPAPGIYPLGAHLRHSGGRLPGTEDLRLHDPHYEGMLKRRARAGCAQGKL